jgi:hypothetical protein
MPDPFSLNTLQGGFMMHCPLCGSVAHTRSSRYLSEATKERYHQCQNINCSCTFATHESVARVIVKPGDIIPAQPHPEKTKPRATAL